MLCFLCTLLLPAMTGRQFHRRKKMVGSGALGVSVAEERSFPVSGLPANSPASSPGIYEDSVALEIDYLSQARKALSERSPVDVAEETSTSTASTLPSGLASFLNRHSDNRRRHKKSHSGGKKKKSSRAGEKSRDSNFWVEMEEYFRDLTLADIDTLFEASSFSGLFAGDSFSIPVLGNARRFDVDSSENDKNVDGYVNSMVMKNEDGFVGIESIDNLAAETVPRDDKNLGTSDSGINLEWLLGCRSKISLTSERPSKKRKLLGGDAGLEKLLIAGTCDENQSVCHYCGMGDTGRKHNQLFICSSCKVAVHQKCYGVQDDVDGSWLCSWCKQKDDVSASVNPCVLCPKKGGALKLVNRSVESAEPIQFAHLFCCLWMPEVYIDDLNKMEPVINVEGIKETRRKLVCNVCKVKCGACVRCSHGTCRTSFHPLCARDTRYRMEVWAKHGSDNVELRAFCSKHSDIQENSNALPLGGSVAFGSEFSDANCLPVTLPVDSEHILKIGCENEGVASHSSPDKLGHNEPEDGVFSNNRLHARNMVGCDAVQLQHSTGVAGRTNESLNASDSLNFVLVLKKLIDLGKVDAKDVAVEVGISPDTLTANINEACMAPDVQHKIVNWLKAHVYTNAFQKDIKVKFKTTNASKNETGVTDGFDTLSISDSGLLDPVAVKSVPPRRRTISSIRILKDSTVICSSEVVTSENGMPKEKYRAGQFDHENPGASNEVSSPGAPEMSLTKFDDTFPEVQGNSDMRYEDSLSGCAVEEKTTVCWQKPSMLCDQHCPAYSALEPTKSGFIQIESISSYEDSYISKKLQQILNGVLLEDSICPNEEGNNSLVESSKASDYLSNQNQLVTCIDICKPDQENMEQLDDIRRLGVLEFSPEDEVERELIYYQHRLLQNAVGRKRLIGNLIFNVAKSLPQEIDAAHQKRWDAVLVNQYLSGLREARKQGRKERRHKEAQAVLAAATAAAAASSRVSSFRKDSLEESVQQETLIKVECGRTGACSQPMPRAKETLSRAGVARTSSEKNSNFGLPTSDFSKEQSKLCDICRRPETMLNPILVCSCCKIAVHLNCYCSVKETVGPWHCELCEDLSSRNSGVSAVNFWEKPCFVAECGLCGGTTGAFRKSFDGQWVHAFCAEWVFNSTFKRGQLNAVEGMGTVLKGVDICCICHHKHGVCLKCSYGHCQTTFHPSCARSAGFYMNVRTAGGKQQHKAYCERHSLEQRAKAENQKPGIEELKSMKKIRVELERLRLLCERIVKREKIKRELVLCAHDILAFKRDHVARSVLVHNPFILPNGSSESATTSLKGNTEGNRSCSEAVQRSDDVTVDSSVSAKHRVRVPISMESDPKLDDDCSTSQSRYNHKIPDRMKFSGKQIPHRATATSRNLLDESGWRSKSRKHAETFEKELVMTSDEASMRNSRLPKGYAYVPADCLSNDKQSNQDEYASGPVEPDG